VNEVERDKYGRYVLPTVGGELRSWTRATTFGGYLADKHHLRLWNERMLIKGLVASPELLEKAANIDPGDSNGYAKLAERSREFAGGNVASELGTSVHDALDAHLKSGDLLVAADSPHREDVQAIMDCLAGVAVKPIKGMSERIITRPDLKTTNSVAGVAGTFDFLADAEGLPTICDLKTGKNPLLFGALEISAQLATYAGATHTWNGSELEPMPEVRQGWGLIVHCRPGSGHAEIFQVGLTIGRQHIAGTMKLYAEAVERNRRQRKIQDTRDRAMVIGIINNPDLIARVAGLSLDDKQELNQAVYRAIDEGGDKAKIFVSPEPVTVEFDLTDETRLRIRQAAAKRSWGPYKRKN
jgi:hypothetical protein